MESTRREWIEKLVTPFKKSLDDVPKEEDDGASKETGILEETLNGRPITRKTFFKKIGEIAAGAILADTVRRAGWAQEEGADSLEAMRQALEALSSHEKIIAKLEQRIQEIQERYRDITNIFPTTPRIDSMLDDYDTLMVLKETIQNGLKEVATVADALTGTAAAAAGAAPSEKSKFEEEGSKLGEEKIAKEAALARFKTIIEAKGKELKEKEADKGLAKLREEEIKKKQELQKVMDELELHEQTGNEDKAKQFREKETKLRGELQKISVEIQVEEHELGIPKLKKELQNLQSQQKEMAERLQELTAIEGKKEARGNEYRQYKEKYESLASSFNKCQTDVLTIFINFLKDAKVDAMSSAELEHHLQQLERFLDAFSENPAEAFGTQVLGLKGLLPQRKEKLEEYRLRDTKKRAEFKRAGVKEEDGKFFLPLNENEPSSRLELSFVPAGRVPLGLSQEEAGVEYYNEAAKQLNRFVSIAKGFMLGTSEITKEQYYQIINEDMRKWREDEIVFKSKETILQLEKALTANQQAQKELRKKLPKEVRDLRKRIESVEKDLAKVGQDLVDTKRRLEKGEKPTHDELAKRRDTQRGAKFLEKEKELNAELEILTELQGLKEGYGSTDSDGNYVFKDGELQLKEKLDKQRKEISRLENELRKLRRQSWMMPDGKYSLEEARKPITNLSEEEIKDFFTKLRVKFPSLNFYIPPEEAWEYAAKSYEELTVIGEKTKGKTWCGVSGMVSRAAELCEVYSDFYKEDDGTEEYVVRGTDARVTSRRIVTAKELKDDEIGLRVYVEVK